MSKLSLQPLTAADSALVSSWFDEAAANWIDDGEKWTARILRLCESNPGTNRAFILYDGSEAVGSIWLSWVGPRCYFERVVAPARRGHGYGSALLILAARHPDLAAIEFFCGSVHEDNSICRHSLHKLGFPTLTDIPELDAWDHLEVAARRDGIAALSPVSVQKVAAGRLAEAAR